MVRLLVVTLKSCNHDVVCLEPNVSFLLLLVSFTVHKLKKWCSFVKIALLTKTRKYHKLLQ